MPLSLLALPWMKRTYGHCTKALMWYLAQNKISPPKYWLLIMWKSKIENAWWLNKQNSNPGNYIKKHDIYLSYNWVDVKYNNPLPGVLHDGTDTNSEKQLYVFFHSQISKWMLMKQKLRILYPCPQPWKLLAVVIWCKIMH